VRGYLTGTTKTSIWHHYEKGSRLYCGHQLPDGMKKNQPLPKPLVTPTTKAERGGHDEPISRDDVIARGLADADTFDRLSELCLKMFAFGVARARERGFILVDTKYELGRTPDGKIVFIDEIHTPDSSHYWFADDYEARVGKGEEPRGLDKDFVRRHYTSIGYSGDGAPPAMPDDVRVEAARRYIALYEQLTGQAFTPDTSDPLPRIRKNLKIG
jgi:phosphoribosylaminoimidazole-succinocarboxamide synthase